MVEDLSLVFDGFVRRWLMTLYGSRPSALRNAWMDGWMEIDVCYWPVHSELCRPRVVFNVYDVRIDRRLYGLKRRISKPKRPGDM
jgi:hypothetical protein